MNDKFELTEEQKNFIMEKMGVSDINAVRLVFEVDSHHTESITKDYTEKSSTFRMKMCSCGDGTWSWLCC